VKTLIPFVALVLLVPPGLALGKADEEPALNVRATAIKIQTLLQKKDYEGADKAFETALKADPDNPQMHSLRRTLALTLSRAKRHKEAIAHAGALVDFQLERFGKDPEVAGAASSAIGVLLSVARKAEQPEIAEKKLEAALAAMAKAHEKKPGATLADELSQLKGMKVTHLVEVKRTEEAAAFLKQELAEARRWYALDKTDLGNTLALANLLNSQADLLETVSPEKAQAAAEEFRSFIAARAKEHSDKSEIVGLFLNAKMMEFYEVVQADVDAGRKVQAELKSYLARLESDNPQLKALATRGTQLLTGMSRQIESSQAHQEMVGKPATALDVETWVNGSSLTDKDLAGKVVLLDFWAVWCGPCIATFPHLREWQDKYSEKGLVIIGMTNYYEYDWDEQNEAIERVRGLEPEKEVAAMLKFAAYHKLKHRFAVMPQDSEFAKSYGVQGIPQVVLIDRAGKVRMIRVGSGSRNAHDLEVAIKKALGAPAPAASGG
jgi:thiol-disulfide isomerase/thioredoxin